ncbi:hypothetical protein E3C22_19600 [Jiella endophytica]|uniref:TniQ domain-containing protein n=1 Tax=Jiella endophytica TaxID=2558362 RepID=A0A4Y8RE50_9HYPH|nr:TniQ family protein [Jiella endophytica]TFF19871.1 hypothetical protein E3C22_19600 [Jiella endophytica]
MTPGLLPRRPRPRHDETPWSYASRLAWANGASSLEHLVTRWGFRVFDIGNGNPAALSLLAALAGVEPLSAATGIVMDGRTYRIGRELVRKSNLARRRFRVCPVCVAEDVASRSGSPTLRTHGRLPWAIEALSTCREHEVALREYEPAATIGGVEFAYCIETNLPAILQDARAPERRVPVGAETYLAGRVFGGGHTAPFLDGLPYHVADRLMEIVGMTLTEGPAAVRHGRPPADLHLARAEGFEVLKDGADGLRRIMRMLVDDALADPDANWGLRPMLGRLHDCFLPRESGPEVEPIREIIAEFVAETMPHHHAGVAVGRKVESRLLSIRSASEMSGWHPKTLRKVLRLFEMIGPETDGLMDERVVFERAAFEARFPPASETFSRNALAEYLQMSRVHGKIVIETYIEPFYGKDKRYGIGEFRFTRAAADAFMDRLFAGAVEVDAPADGMVDIYEARHRTLSTVPQMIDLILSGRLTWKGRLAGRRDYGALLLDLAEVRQRLSGEDHGGLAAYKAAKIMKTRPEVVAALIRIGALPSFIAKDPVNKCDVLLVRPADIEAFQARYVSLFTLARERGEHFRHTMQFVQRAALRPCFDPRIVDVCFYDRHDLPTPSDRC